MLHGYTDSDEQWFGFKKHFISVPDAMEKALAAGTAREMILVMPNAFTAFQGSMYSSSVTTGDWETFVTGDLVSYIDTHYRTIADRRSRGLTGHSMGGYGTIRIGMRHPEIYSSIYIMSACCMSAGAGGRGARAETIHSLDELAQADFGTKAYLASGAAWSPNPGKPPLYLDLPSKDGQPQPDILAKWAANAPLAMIDQYILNLQKLDAIAMDVGDRDAGIAATTMTLDQVLTAYGVAHTFEVYEGDHTSGVAERVSAKVLPFFSNNLSFEQPRR
jgi:enterochelin esterase-like enzyme